MIDFGVLGTLAVRRDGVSITIRTVKARQLLALLLTRPGEPFSVEKIADVLWPEEQPASARRSVAVYISRLRDVIDDRIERHPAGYLIRPLPGELDSIVFERTAGDANAAATDPASVGDALRRALDLWRGPAFEEFRGIVTFDEAADHLDDKRVTVFERWADIELGTGRVDLIPELAAMIAGHRFRERLRAQLMLALYRAGRAAEALDAYRQTYRLFIDELGVEPGAALVELHARILRGDPTLELVRARPASVPRALPAVVAGFTGRVDHLERIEAALDESGRSTPIAIVSGTAGVGKTTLAVYWAHRAAYRFPDGQLYANLHGFDPAREPVPPADVLRTLLTLLDAPMDDPNADLDALSAMFRSRTAGRRILIVVDNARNASQVRPLLAAGAPSFTVITSRDPLLELIAVEGATHVPLPVMTDAEGIEMLAQRLGADRIRAESGAAADIVALCARLPLAIAIAAARAAVRPSMDLRATADALMDRHRALDELDLSESAGIRAAFAMSFEALSTPAATLFRRLGVHPGPDFGVPIAATLVQVEIEAAAGLLDELTYAHLVEEHQPGRYRLHDLLRRYAAELVAGGTDGDEALGRLIDHYTYAAYSAKMVDQPEARPLEQVPDGADVAPESIGDQAQARAWFRAEMEVLLAVHREAALNGADRATWQLCWSISQALVAHGREAEYVEVARRSLASAQRLDDGYALLIANRGVGKALVNFGRYVEAVDYLVDAARYARRIGDTEAESQTQQIIGHAYSYLGRHQEALECAMLALELNAINGRPFRLGAIHNDIGYHHARLGNYAEAYERARQAIALFEALGAGIGQGAAWSTLGLAADLSGDHEVAVDAYQRSIKLRLEGGYPHTAAESLETLGDIHLAAGDTDLAAGVWREALDLLTDANLPMVERIKDKIIRLYR